MNWKIILITLFTFPLAQNNEYGFDGKYEANEEDFYLSNVREISTRNPEVLRSTLYSYINTNKLVLITFMEKSLRPVSNDGGSERYRDWEEDLAAVLESFESDGMVVVNVNRIAAEKILYQNYLDVYSFIAIKPGFKSLLVKGGGEGIDVIIRYYKREWKQLAEYLNNKQSTHDSVTVKDIEMGSSRVFQRWGIDIIQSNF